MTTNALKQCIICNKKKPANSDNFYRNSRNADHLENTCKDCRKSNRTVGKRKKTTGRTTTGGGFIKSQEFDFPEKYRCLHCIKITDRPTNPDWKEKYLNKIVMTHCLEVLVELPTESVDVIVMDPPYVDSSEMIVGNDKLLSEVYVFELFRVLKSGGAIYCFASCRKYHQFATILEKHFSIRTPLIWFKRGMGMGDFAGDYINQAEMVVFAVKGSHKLRAPQKIGNFFDIGRAGNSHHPFEKPVKLLTEFIENSSDEGDVVLDPYAGSGSTLVAAKACNRNYIGCEIDKKWYDQAVLRLLDTMKDSVSMQIKGVDTSSRH